MLAADRKWVRGLVLACLAVLQPAAAAAESVQIPGVPEPFFGFSGLRMDSDMFVLASDPTFQEPGQSGTASMPDGIRTLLTSDFRDSLEVPAGSISVTSGSATTTAAVDGTAAFGTLRAFGSVERVGGFAEGRATVIVEFWDLIHVQSTDGSQSNLNFDLNWKTDGTITGAGLAVAQLWLIDTCCGGPSQHVNRGTYAQSAWTLNGVTDFTLGKLENTPVNTRYWVYGRLRVEASRASSSLGFASSVVDFRNTAQLFIDARADSPGAFITSTSGYDYRTPVPEPSILVLVSAGLACAALQRRRRSRL